MYAEMWTKRQGLVDKDVECQVQTSRLDCEGKQEPEGAEPHAAPTALWSGERGRASAPQGLGTQPFLREKAVGVAIMTATHCGPQSSHSASCLLTLSHPSHHLVLLATCEVARTGLSTSFIR